MIVKNCLRALLAVTVLIMLVGTGVQASDEDIRAELKLAQAEIAQLHQEMAELKESSVWQYQAELKEAMKNMPVAGKDEAKGVLDLPAGWSIKPYGYFKFDMSYDDSSVNGADGDYVVHVRPENSVTRSDDKFSATARQTRLGMKVFAPNIGDVKVMGRVEFDFYNPLTADVNENKSTPQMRHAYGELIGKDWSFIFGQTTDIISPLCPNTLNYTVGWFGGNVGYRHPQLSFAKWWDCPNGNRFKIETAISRETGNDNGAVLVDDGQDNGDFPTLLSRVSCELPMSGKKLVAGVSGHYGKEEVDWDYVGDDEDVHTWSLNADLTVPVCKTVELKGEFFWAENFDSYFGGIGQGVNTVTRDEIETVGGWAQIGIKPCAAWAFNTGAGIDDPVDSDLNNGDRSNNLFAFTNANYFFSKYLSTGIEISYWQTEYKNTDDGDDFRVQHSWMLKF